MTKNRKKNNLIAYGFVMPSLLTFLIFMVFPMMFSFFLSFNEWNMFRGFTGMKFVGVENFIKIFSDDYFIAAIKNNLMFTLIAIPLLLILSLLIATLLNQKIFLRGTIRTMVFMPYVASITAAAVVFSVLFNPKLGPINTMLKNIGITNPPGWIMDPKWALVTVALFWVWKQLGYCVVIFLAGLQGISKSYYEAANIDGASSISKFFHITLPLISPTTFFILITNVIASFKLFPEVQVMTEGGPGNATMTMIQLIYRKGFAEHQMGYASAIAWIFFVLVLLVTIVQWIGQKKWVNYDV